jgi:hypothetical protein
MLAAAIPVAPMALFTVVEMNFTLIPLVFVMFFCPSGLLPHLRHLRHGKLTALDLLCPFALA